MQNKIEYIPFHKDVAKFINVGELEMTPDGIGCKVNDFLVVLYYRCDTLEKMNEIKEKGFQLEDTEFGKGIVMYKNYADAVKGDAKYIIFNRITKGQMNIVKKEEAKTLDREKCDLIQIEDSETSEYVVLNLVNIETIAFMEF